MVPFDASKDWAILAPLTPVTQNAAEDLARCIGLLRKQVEGMGEKIPGIVDAAGAAPDDSVPIIVLNMNQDRNERAGYSWRIGQGRIEIYGDSPRGICNGIYAFLASLGFRWPVPGQEQAPPPPTAGSAVYTLKEQGACVHSAAPESRRRLIMPTKISTKEILALGRWAARNRVDALVFSLFDRKIAGSKLAAELQNRWALVLERGGWDLSRLVPRRSLFFKRDCFRMEEGKRIQAHHFCPTSPDTIAILQRQTSAFLARQKTKAEARRIYHLWPDRDAEELWCACPACRAFSPREQIRMAVNTVAAMIAEKDPQALIFCRGEENPSEEQLPGGSEITLRPNVFRLPAILYLYEGGTIKEL
ncbi:MAG: hypothetical protein LBT39_06925 [Treponema sp.]|jgi:hypothetical protein|nr:hypothetical protein [Treponema sp.]